VDSGLIGLTVPSLILFFKNKLEKFNSLLFFYSLLLLGLGLAALPYAPPSQLWLLSLIFILGFAVGVFEYRRVLRYLASLRRQTKTKMEVFLESCLVLFTMFFYFFSIVGLFPSSMMWQGGTTDIVSHFTGLLFGSVIFSSYAFYLPNKQKSQTLEKYAR
jgi:NADH:ubiquinone oxidoreductase subunit 2 (subunit N)